MNITDLATTLTNDIRNYGDNTPRTQQSRDGVLGPSDLGFCRQKAALTTRGITDTDPVSTAAAQIGTAIHEYVAKAFAVAHPTWHVDNNRVTATFPSGVEISGTPDLITDPEYNAIVDVKTVDGFNWVKREGTSQNHKYQRHTYALAAIQAGLLDGNKTVWVCNLYIDRSGKEKEPYFTYEEFDPSLTDEIDSWIGDVIYAVKNGEDASRDIPSPICEQICGKFTACRGGLETHEGGVLIDDADTKNAIRMYLDGRDLEKEGASLKREASARLHGINGTDGEYQVRWVDVAPTTVNTHEKAGYSRLDVRKARK